MRVAPPIPPCNHVAIKRPSGTKVSGSFVIDPELEIPTELLAPVEEGEERKHLIIDVPNSQVDVDVWVVPHPLFHSDTKSHTTNLEVHGSHVAMRLHSTGDRPISLTVKAGHSGQVSLEIPSTFRGPMTIHNGNGNVKFSSALDPLVATFSDVDKVRKCFIGDFKQLGFGQGAWEGSALEIHSLHGSVKLRFADEYEPTVQSKSWWSL
ncbi:hypothetical protein AURDEDRAFT_160188 [Auricularia subglabra TFB-10046 SS5]|nr:hypothetical protein AURDEDRAFT_160188 [Auricularia subglabra TFB-10046 SS5]